MHLMLSLCNAMLYDMLCYVITNQQHNLIKKAKKKQKKTIQIQIYSECLWI